MRQSTQRVGASYLSVCCVFCCTIGKHTLACNRHAVVFFTAVEHWAKVLLSLFAAQYSDFTCLWMSLSSFSEAFNNIPRYLTWSENCTFTPFGKIFDGAGWLYLWGQKDTPIVLLQLKAISCSASSSSSQISKRQWSPLMLGPHVCHQQTSDDSRSYFPQCNPFLMIFPVRLSFSLKTTFHTVRQGRNQLIFSGEAKWCNFLLHLTNIYVCENYGRVGNCSLWLRACSEVTLGCCIFRYNFTCCHFKWHNIDI